MRSQEVAHMRRYRNIGIQVDVPEAEGTSDDDFGLDAPAIGHQPAPDALPAGLQASAPGSDDPLEL